MEEPVEYIPILKYYIIIFYLEINLILILKGLESQTRFVGSKLCYHRTPGKNWKGGDTVKVVIFYEERMKSSVLSFIGGYVLIFLEISLY